MTELTDTEREALLNGKRHDGETERHRIARVAGEIKAAAREAGAQEVRAKIEALAEDFDSNIDWSNGRHDYGDNAAWESAARQLRALLADGGEPQ